MSNYITVKCNQLKYFFYFKQFGFEFIISKSFAGLSIKDVLFTHVYMNSDRHCEANIVESVLAYSNGLLMWY